MTTFDKKLSKNELMVFVPTVRSDLQAILNISCLFQISSVTKVTILVGYGGDNLDYFNNLCLRASYYNGLGADISLLSNPSSFERFKWAFSHNKDWILFVSDDDPYTTNHIENYRNFIENPNDDLSNVTSVIPNMYFVYNDKGLICHETHGYDDTCVETRLKKLLSAPYNGLRFWSAFRLDSIRDRISEAVKYQYMPSYFDQLLVYSACIEGISVRHRRVGGIFYNDSNWSTPEIANRSDLRSYSKPVMILFHEVLWLSDYIRVTKHLNISNNFFIFFKSYSQSRIGHSLRSFEARASLLLASQKCTQNILKRSFESLITIKSDIDNCNSWCDIKNLPVFNYQMGDSFHM
jgi:hypothetical protein